MDLKPSVGIDFAPMPLKIAAKYFYSDFYLFESILFYIQSIPQEDTELWITRYIFLLWLSLLCMIPFDLSRIGSDLSGNTNIIDSLLILCKHYLSMCGKERDAASVLAGKLLTRRDTYKVQLPSFISWIQDTWTLETTSDFMVKICMKWRIFLKIIENRIVIFIVQYFQVK